MGVVQSGGGVVPCHGGNAVVQLQLLQLQQQARQPAASAAASSARPSQPAPHLHPTPPRLPPPQNANHNCPARYLGVPKKCSNPLVGMFTLSDTSALTTWEITKVPSPPPPR